MKEIISIHAYLIGKVLRVRRREAHAHLRIDGGHAIQQLGEPETADRVADDDEGEKDEREGKGV